MISSSRHALFLVMVVVVKTGTHQRGNAKYITAIGEVHRGLHQLTIVKEILAKGGRM
jgi:hypothetical protein